MTTISNELQVATTEMNLELTKLGFNYQKMLQDAEDITFTKENINQDYAPLKKLREMETAISNLDNPHTKAWSEWNRSRKSILDPVAALTKKKTADFTALANEIKADNAKIAAENLRIANIKLAISNFTLEYSTKIASATTFDELNALHMRIGAEKSRKTAYQEFMPQLLEAVEGLENALKTQKTSIKQLTTLEDEKKEAEQSGNDEKLLELLTQEESITAQIEETKTTVQQGALQSVGKSDIPVADMVLSTAPRARRTVLDWTVTDINLLFKKMPSLVTLTPNSKAIDELAKFHKEGGGKDFKEVVFPGLKIYMKEIY